MNPNTLKRFCTVAFWEGVSYIVLLGIAMPLKYFADMPLAVKYTGWAHGVLFVAYVALLIKAWIEYDWSFKRVFVFFIASLLPFVPFVIEKKLRAEIKSMSLRDKIH